MFLSSELSSVQIQRFWSRVRKTRGCWTWTGGCTSGGYGYFDANYRRHGAHRVSYALAHGAVPDGKNVLHTCDNPACVRPSHLFVGDQLANMRDMIAKGRRGNTGVPGSRNGRAKLNEREVQSIRRAFATGKHSKLSLARKYGVSDALIGMIVRREAWPHVP